MSPHRRAKHWLLQVAEQPAVYVPALIMLLATAPLISFGMPNYEDTLSESYEPLKTIKFLLSHGHELHKWGALQNFLYAPWYVAMIVYWKMTGAFGPPSHSYPYGLHDGIRQLGILIIGARVINLLLMSAALTLATAGAAALVRSVRWAAVTVAVVVACTPAFLKMCPDTNPQGTMLACMLAAVGFYLMMLAHGPSRWTAFACGAMCALAMSCKEQAIPAAASMAAGTVVIAWPPRSMYGVTARADFSFTFRTVAYFGIGTLLTYLAVNVVYAPHSWSGRLHYLTTSAYMDPQVWSAGTGAFNFRWYLRDTIRAIGVSLGMGGILLVALAALLTPRWRAREIAAGWLPIVIFVSIVFIKAGYMATYFMSIVGALAVIPAALALRYVQTEQRWRKAACIGALMLSPLLLIGVTLPLQWMRMAPSSMVAAYEDRHCRNGERIHSANLYRLPDDGDRERSRGLNPDARPLGLALADHTAPPTLIIIPSDLEQFINEFAQNPRRAKMFSEQSGVDYDGFRGLGAAGYQLVDTISAPRYAPRVMGWLMPHPEQITIHVYRRVVESSRMDDRPLVMRDLALSAR